MCNWSQLNDGLNATGHGDNLGLLLFFYKTNINLLRVGADPLCFGNKTFLNLEQERNQTAA